MRLNKSFSKNKKDFSIQYNRSGRRDRYNPGNSESYAKKNEKEEAREKIVLWLYLIFFIHWYGFFIV